MKNILYLSKTMGVGGTEKVVLQLCDGLKEEFEKIVVVSSGGVHEKWLNEQKIKHYRIESFDNKNPLVIFKTLKQLLKIIKSENINVVHSQHRMGTFYCKLLNYFIDFKLVHTAHNTFYDKKLITKFAFKDISIIAVGNQVKKNLTDFYGVKNGNINVIYNGIKKEEYKNVDYIEKIKNNGNFIVGNIGRLSEQKGIEFFLKAIPGVIEKEENIRFLVIGDGELREPLELLAKRLEIKEYVEFLGYRSDVLNIISSLDLVVLSSLWEGLPLTPIETFMQGKTIIATDVDGTGEVVRDGFNGILIQPKNSEEIEKNILNLYKNNSLRNKLEENALKTYEKEFTYNIFIERYRKFYKVLMGE